METIKNGDHFSLILFGATGDLAQHKVFPALYFLLERDLLPKPFSIMAIGRTEHTDESFRHLIDESLKLILKERYVPATAQILLKGLHYLAGDLNQPQLYQDLKTQLSQLQAHQGFSHNLIFQLSIMPSLYETVIDHLGQNFQPYTCGWLRVMIEKPFGNDLASAQKLDTTIKHHFSENQVFRIDHYLSKETVQNIFAFRFGNGLLEPIWNRDFVDHIQISMLESQGIGKRGPFYDRTGAVRDVIQNHLLQVLALTTMDIPESFSVEALRQKRQELLAKIKPLTAAEIADFTVRGQYQGYQEELQVEAGSSTETFSALRLEIESERWGGVPIYLRTGKNLSHKTTKVSIVFKQQPSSIVTNLEGYSPQANVLTIRLVPEEGVGLSFLVKKPGPRLTLTPASMQFHYKDLQTDLMESYEKILLDAFSGDQTLFTSSHEVESQWRIIDPILKGWQAGGAELLPYDKGTDGPTEARLMLEREGRSWV
jgi:glucose-6-phosphate 1-dehydrogenase